MDLVSHEHNERERERERERDKIINTLFQKKEKS